jgi:hypothetical protein
MKCFPKNLCEMFSKKEEKVHETRTLKNPEYVGRRKNFGGRSRNAVGEIEPGSRSTSPLYK